MVVSPPLFHSCGNATKILTKHLIENFLTTDHFHVVAGPSDIRTQLKNITFMLRRRNFSHLYILAIVFLRAIGHKNKLLIHCLFTPRLVNTLPFVCLKKIFGCRLIISVCSFPSSRKSFPLLKHFDRIICLSDHSKMKLEGYGLSQAQTIYPGIPTRLPKQSYDPGRIQKLKNELCITTERVILFAGDYEFSGANDLILKSAQYLKKRNYFLKYVLACRRKTKKSIVIESELKQEIAKSHLKESFLFLNEVSDMQTLIHLSTICIFPARSLKQKMDIPLFLLEALACVKPIVISPLPSLKEIFKKEVGVIMNSFDATSLGRAISRLLDDKKFYTFCQKNANQVIKDFFNISKIANSYEEVYESFFKKS